MDHNSKLKLFISYSHEDNKGDIKFIDEFKKHLTILKNNGLIEYWYDREILPGENWQEKIDNNLEDADIVCLFISPNFISSSSCQREKEQALQLKETKGIQVVPIILSHCPWIDDKEISNLLVLPTDGIPVDSFDNRNEVWMDVYKGLKKIIMQEIKIKQLKIKPEFKSFLDDVEVLSKAHFGKETIFLKDIFISPELNAFNELKEFEKKISFDELLRDVLAYKKVAIAGESQSGKTTLCKVLFNELRKKNFIPVYISVKNGIKGNFKKAILKNLKNQYENLDIDEINSNKIIPIIDDFHLDKNKETHIRYLTDYPHSVITIDDIFDLNIRDENIISSYRYFKINEFTPSLRYKLIKKWKTLNLKEDREVKDIELYKDIDKTIELIDSTLGKAFGKGVMPSYPFFILSAIMAYETFAMPLNQEITSQGYCYEALIYFYLTRQGVKNEEIDIYLNFLTEFAYYLFDKDKNELSIDEFEKFLEYYKEKFTLPIENKVLLKKLRPLIDRDSFSNYSFKYPYIYYFFVAKYLAENLEKNNIWKKIENIIENLHIDENAYITIFIVHHTKHLKIIEEIELNALCLFDKYKSATLENEEVSFFDEKVVDTIIDAVLPDTVPEKEREKRLKVKDEIESENEHKSHDVGNGLEKDLRRAIKTTEVIGSILKNRIGSLEKVELEKLLESAIDIYLRILSFFFSAIKDEDFQKSIIEYISEKLENILKKKKKDLNKNELREQARIIFWNINLFFIYAIFSKATHTLGSDKLIEIVENVCNKIDTPASFLLKHGIRMWYLKNLRIEEIVKRMDKKDFSFVAKKVIKLQIINHCSIHPISYRDRDKLEKRLGISSKKILIESFKKSKDN